MRGALHGRGLDLQGSAPSCLCSLAASLSRVNSRPREPEFKAYGGYEASGPKGNCMYVIGLDWEPWL